MSQNIKTLKKWTVCILWLVPAFGWASVKTLNKQHIQGYRFISIIRVARQQAIWVRELEQRLQTRVTLFYHIYELKDDCLPFLVIEMYITCYKDSLCLQASHGANRKYKFLLGSFPRQCSGHFLTCEARCRISGEWLHFLSRLLLFHERTVTFQSVIQGSRNFFLWLFVRKISGRI